MKHEDWKPRKIKWRFQCANCGVALPEAPTTWAYHSKQCELARKSDEEEGDMPEWAVKEHIDLGRELENNIPSDQAAKIRARMTYLATLVVDDDVERPDMPQNRPSKNVAQFWINPINREIGKLEVSIARSIKAGIRVGQMLLDAKMSVDRGEFGKLFRDHDRPVDRAMPFTRSWGNRLMSIAVHPYLGNPDNVEKIPANVDFVYKLTRLSGDAVAALVEQGSIHPRMTSCDVTALLPASTRRAPSRKTLMSRAARSIVNALEKLRRQTGDKKTPFEFEGLRVVGA